MVDVVFVFDTLHGFNAAPPEDRVDALPGAPALPAVQYSGYLNGGEGVARLRLPCSLHPAYEKCVVALGQA